MRPIIAIAIAFVASISVAPVGAQPADAIRYYRDAYQTVANNYRSAIRSFIPSTKRRDLDRISFRFLPSQNLVAQAYVAGNGRRIIEVSFGFLAFMENLTLAYAVAGEANEPECYFSYLDAAASSVFTNTQRRINGLPPNLVPFFSAYVQNGGKGCESISFNDLRNPNAHSLIPGGMDSVMAILIGHEIAHHLLGHVDGGGPDDLAETRKFEAEADFWAVEHSIAIGVIPTPALPLWSFFAATGGADIGDELESSHPLGIRRWANALERILQYMRSQAYAHKYGTSPPEWVLQEMKRMTELVREQVP